MIRQSSRDRARGGPEKPSFVRGRKDRHKSLARSTGDDVCSASETDYYSDTETDYYSCYSQTDYVSEYTTDESRSGGKHSQRYRSSRHSHLPSQASRWYPDDYFKILGKGHFGAVYMAYSRAKRKLFAVKCVRRSTRSNSSAARSLKREAEFLKKLDSPYILKYLGERQETRCLKVGNARGKTSVVTEIYVPYMKRGTLSDLIAARFKKRRRLDESLIQHYTKQLLKAVHYIHSKGIVHCDIKGSNVLLGETHIKLSDFGVAKYADNCYRNRRNGLISRAGTRAWMAPEVHARQKQGFAADIWSLGCTVVQMITGKPPNSHLKSFLESLGERDEDASTLTFPADFDSVSVECLCFLGKCFQTDPDSRWTSGQLLCHPFLNLVEPGKLRTYIQARTTTAFEVLRVDQKSGGEN